MPLLLACQGSTLHGNYSIRGNQDTGEPDNGLDRPLVAAQE